MRSGVLLAVVLAALAAAAPASASINQLSLFMDDNRLLYRGDAVSERTMRELADLGVDAVRVSVHWRAIAPSHRSRTKPRPLRYDPGVFHNLDRVLRLARRHEMGVLFNVTGGAPRWATGTRRGRFVSLQYKPDAKEFEAFVEMLGRRFPTVQLWSIWNEPNQGALLQPQWENGRPYSPGLYRRLARAALAGLRRSGHAEDRILLGETAPLGVDRRDATANMRPGLFLRELLCLDGAGTGCDFERRGPLRVTGYAHHPYSIVFAPDVGSSHPDEITLADRDRLARILDDAASEGRFPRDLPMWWTEYGWQTDPPDPLRGVSLTDQARWLGQAERMAWEDSRVAALTQFLLLDDRPRRGERPGSRRYWGTYQSGLRFSDGRRKPAYDAYRLPLTAPGAVSAGAPLTLWGRVRPAAPGDDVTVQLEFSPQGSEAWSPVERPLPVSDPQGVFQRTLTASRSGRYRFRWSPTPRGASAAGAGAFTSAPVAVAVAGPPQAR
jgi:hypothetical protein